MGTCKAIGGDGVLDGWLIGPAEHVPRANERTKDARLQLSVPSIDTTFT